MNIKSLLLGSAAALAAVSGAQAADAIVAAEPEPMEYVRVCDAFGTGYFYIPGTETCLQIGGWVRFQVDFGRNQSGSSDWDATGRAYLTTTAKSDTELGTLTSFIAVEADWDGSGPVEPGPGANSVYIDEAYLQLGGFKAGYFYSWWDKGINGETDVNGNVTQFVSAAYIYEGDSFSAGISVDELEGINADTAVVGLDGTPDSDATNGLGVAGIVSASFGAVSADLLGGYDTESEDGAIRGLISADIGPGTLQVLGVYASGVNAYWAASEWSVAASYKINATETLSITPAVQYFSDRNFDGAGSPDSWKYGVTVGYKITT
ncbi:porin, partial [Pararhizobium sp.]|uniref:porin n=1 Tax=Pararhizobium sp. TaxID=1977563 RepID=UPI0027271BE4